MDGPQFDGWTRTLVATSGRRAIVRGLAGALLGIGIASANTDARNKHNHKDKIKRNEFDCVNVGKTCKNNGDCCSGICEGKKDKKKCKGHDSFGCKAGQKEAFCAEDGVDVPCLNGDGTCNTSTGKSGVCTVSGTCAKCKKDRDCHDLCGPRASCVVCAGCIQGTGCISPTDSCPLDTM